MNQINEKDLKIIDYSKYHDEEKYAYAICKCTLFGEGIEIPRPEHNTFFSFECPRCGESLGIWIRGKSMASH